MIGYCQFIIDTATSVNIHDIISIFQQNENISINYCRDISQSTRKLFRTDSQNI